MLSAKLRDLSPAGWTLALLSAVTIAAVAIAVGEWALDLLRRSSLGRWTTWLVPLLALPGFGAGLAFWTTGARILHACGVPTMRLRAAPAPRQFR